MRRTLVGLIICVLLTGIAGCELFFPNRAPAARITASPLSGVRPLIVAFDATSSFDLDGEIRSYTWAFGDGATATGAIVNHVYAPPAGAASYIALLTVTDDDGAVGTAQQSIEVQDAPAPGNNPPSARFTFTPTHGDAPLAVTFDAALTRDADGDVEVYGWDFGDGSTGSGPVISHTYNPLASTDYAVTLTATDDDGGIASTTAIVSVFVPEVVPFEGPNAAFDIGAPTVVYDSPQLPEIPSLFEVDLDPQGSTPAPGHEIVLYVWSFGDGESVSVAEDAAVTHVYRASAPSQTFVVSLTVIDDQGLQDSAVGNVTVNN